MIEIAYSLMLKGWDTQQIADKLCLKESTIRTYIIERQKLDAEYDKLFPRGITLDKLDDTQRAYIRKVGRGW